MAGAARRRPPEIPPQANTRRMKAPEQQVTPPPAPRTPATRRAPPAARPNAATSCRCATIARTATDCGSAYTTATTAKRFAARRSGTTMPSTRLLLALTRTAPTSVTARLPMHHSTRPGRHSVPVSVGVHRWCLPAALAAANASVQARIAARSSLSTFYRPDLASWHPCGLPDPTPAESRCQPRPHGGHRTDSRSCRSGGRPSSTPPAPLVIAAPAGTLESRLGSLIRCLLELDRIRWGASSCVYLGRDDHE